MWGVSRHGENSATNDLGEGDRLGKVKVDGWPARKGSRREYPRPPGTVGLIALVLYLIPP